MNFVWRMCQGFFQMDFCVRRTNTWKNKYINYNIHLKIILTEIYDYIIYVAEYCSHIKQTFLSCPLLAKSDEENGKIEVTSDFSLKNPRVTCPVSWQCIQQPIGVYDYYWHRQPNSERIGYIYCGSKIYFVPDIVMMLLPTYCWKSTHVPCLEGSGKEGY